MTNKKLVNAFVSIIFIAFHLYNFSNKGYLVLLTLFFCISYRINKDVIVSIWHIFLTILPFERGRYFLTFVVEKDFWQGSFPINMEYFIKYSDLFILLILGLFIRKRILTSQKVVLFKNLPVLEISLLVMFLVTAAFSTLNATFTFFAFYQYFTFFILILVFFMSTLIKKYTGEQNFSVSILLLHSCIISILLILQFYKGSQLGTQLEQVSDNNPFGSVQVEAQNRYRPGGYFFDPNAAGMWLLISVPFVIAQIEKKRNNNKETLFYLVVLAFYLVGIVISSSRFIWIVIALLATTYFLQKEYRQLLTQLVKVHKKIFLIVAGVFCLLLPLVLLRLSNFALTFKEGGGVDYRLSHYKLARDFMLNYPLGIGLGMFKYEILGNFPPEQFAYEPTYPHNILVEVAAGSGIVGLLLFCSFLFLNFKRQYLSLVKNKEPFFYAVFLSSVCYIVASQAYPYLLRSPLAEFFWIVMGISLLRTAKNKKI